MAPRWSTPAPVPPRRRGRCPAAGVGAPGLEPGASALSGPRSDRLSYAPPPAPRATARDAGEGEVWGGALACAHPVGRCVPAAPAPAAPCPAGRRWCAPHGPGGLLAGCPHRGPALTWLPPPEILEVSAP